MRKVLACMALALLTTFAGTAQTIGGIGAQLKLDSTEGYTMPLITQLVPGSPAAANLKANTFILKVDGHDCRNQTLEVVVGWIRGNVGTSVNLELADNKKGKHSDQKTLVRAAIAAPADNVDPVTAFYGACEAEVKQMKRNGVIIVKTFNSECGDFFFNFDGEAKTYEVKMWMMEYKGAVTTDLPTVQVTDNADEKNSISLGEPVVQEQVAYSRLQLSNHITFRRETVGTISLKLAGTTAKCKAMYLMVCER